MIDYMMHSIRKMRKSAAELKLRKQAALAGSIVRQTECMIDAIKTHALNEKSINMMSVQRFHFNRERGAIMAAAPLSCHESPSKAHSGNGSDTGAPAVVELRKGQGEV